MPTVTKNLIIINILAFFGAIVAQRYGVNLTDYLGLHFFLSSDFNPAQLITYMFMHGGFAHIFFNMFAVYMFGPVLEHAWGGRRFLLFYIACGIGAGLTQEAVQYIHLHILENGVPQDVLQTIFTQGGDILRSQNYVNETMGALNLTYNSATIGASGAVYAILLGFGLLYPNDRLFIFPLPMPVKAKYLVIGYVIIELWAGVASNPADNVAHFAHLGGMLFALIFILYWKKKDNGTYYS